MPDCPPPQQAVLAWFISIIRFTLRPYKLSHWYNPARERGGKGEEQVLLGLPLPTKTTLLKHPSGELNSYSLLSSLLKSWLPPKTIQFLQTQVKLPSSYMWSFCFSSTKIPTKKPIRYIPLPFPYEICSYTKPSLKSSIIQNRSKLPSSAKTSVAAAIQRVPPNELGSNSVNNSL